MVRREASMTKEAAAEEKKKYAEKNSRWLKATEMFPKQDAREVVLGGRGQREEQ